MCVLSRPPSVAVALQSDVQLRFFIDPSTGEPHIYGHSVTEAEVEEVLARPVEDRPGSEGSRVALGQTESGRYFEGHLRSRSRAGFAVCDHGVRSWSEGAQGTSAQAKEVMKPAKYPDGWDEARVQ